MVQVFNIPLKLNPFPKIQKKISSIYKISQPIEKSCKINNLCFSWEQIGFPSNVNFFLSLWLFANRLNILWQIVRIVLSFSAFDFLPLFGSYQFGRCCFYTNYVLISISPIVTTKVEPIDPNFKRGFSHQLVETPLRY